MDIVFIRDLEVRTVIGVFDWERKIKQKLVFDLDLGTDTKPAAISDELSNALDYDKISHAISDFVERSHYQLIETLAEKVAELLLNDFSIRWVSITLSKPRAVNIASRVGVKIERGNRF